MKAITIMQPWASLVACGAKQIETRSWATKYRGPIAIHAGLNTKFLRQFYTQEPFKTALNGVKPRLGYVIAIADLVDCLEINESQVYYLKLHQEKGISNEYAFGDYTVGRYAWILANVRQIRPILAKGMQRLWEWKP